MKVKQIIGVLLAVVCLLSYCSFSVFAADETILVSDMGVTMSREVIEGSSTISTNFAFNEGTLTKNGMLVHWFMAKDPAYYASGGQKITTLYDYGDLAAGHEYEMTFHAGLNFNARYNIQIFVDRTKIYDHDFSSGGSLSKVNVKFNAPNEITDSARIQVVMTISGNYGYGAGGETVHYYFSENLEFTDLTENPTWLQKILKKFTELGDTIGGFFRSLGDRIGGFFDDLAESIKGKFNDLKTWIENLGNNIKQWFKDLGEDIGDFFTMLKNYLLYFQHPVTTNSDGVLIGADGKPVYTNPFENALQKVEDTVYGWLGSITEFLDGIDESRENVAGYLENGSTLVNGVLKASPILSVCVTFAVAFLVIRKVVGR